MYNSCYGLITIETTGVANDKSIKGLKLGEIVRVISAAGTVAVIKPYNSRKAYAVRSICINTNISQNTKDYKVIRGRRLLK